MHQKESLNWKKQSEINKKIMNGLQSSNKVHLSVNNVLKTTNEAFKLQIKFNKITVFILIYIILNEYLLPHINTLLIILYENWKYLSEAWQIFIINLLFLIPAGVVIQLIANLIQKRIDKNIKK